MKELIGIPYKFNGTDENGIDCYNLVKLYYKEILKNEIKDKVFYKTQTDLDLKAIKNEQKAWIKADKIKNGTLLLIRINNFPIHCGVAINKNQFLHILENKTSCIEKISRWKNKIIGIYDYRNEI